MLIAVSENNRKDIGDLGVFDSKKKLEGTIPNNMVLAEDCYDQAGETRDPIARYESSQRTIKVFHRRDR